MESAHARGILVRFLEPYDPDSMPVETAYKIILAGAAVASGTPAEMGVSVAGTDVASGGALAFSTGVNVAITKDIIISNTGTDALLIAGYWTANSAPAGTVAFSTV
jgi:hypothetical protein